MQLGPQVTTPGRANGVHPSGSSDTTASMLSVLTPEARTMVLASLPPAQRWRIMEAMKDDERASIVLAMGLRLRKEAAAALDGRVWERTMDVIKNNSTNGAKWVLLDAVGSWVLLKRCRAHACVVCHVTHVILPRL